MKQMRLYIVTFKKKKKITFRSTYGSENLYFTPRAKVSVKTGSFLDKF